MDTKPRFFCDIAPVVPIPLRNRQAYTYLSDEVLSRGTLVLIPFGPRTVRGIVLSSSEIASGTVPSARLKRVKSVIRDAFLTDQQTTLAETVSAECLTPLGTTLRHFLPKPTKERPRKSIKNDETKSRTALRLTEPERDAVDRLVERSDGRPFFLEASMERVVRIVSGVRRDLPKRRQVLVLVPELLAIPFVERVFRDRFGSDAVATVHSAVSDGAYFSAWESIRSGDASIIIGTRQALFAPFRDVGLITLLESSETVGYKQWDMSPRYDARRVAMTLSELFGATLLLSGSHRGIDTALAERLGEIRAIRLDEAEPSSRPAVTVAIDMRRERWKKNRSLFSEELRWKIVSARSDGRRVILVVSRGGLDSFSVCVVCKEVPRCPTCDRALRSTREGGFRCPSCSYRTDTFPRCAKCGSLEFRNVGYGTERVEKEATRLFGSSALMRVDDKTFVRADSASAYDRLRSSGILVGTPSILDVGPLPDVALVAIMDADNFLSIPDFRADERFLRTVAKASFITGSTGEVLLQAFRTERDSVRDVVEHSVPELEDRLMRDREALGYPPFTRAFRIAFRHADEKVAHRAAEEAFSALREVAPEGVSVKPPIRPLVGKVRGRYERVVIVTTPREKAFPEALRGILLASRDSWTFDPDPLSLL